MYFHGITISHLVNSALLCSQPLRSVFAGSTPTHNALWGAESYGMTAQCCFCFRCCSNSFGRATPRPEYVDFEGGKTTISHKVRRSISKESFWTRTSGTKHNFVLGHFAFSTGPHLKPERDSGIWFSLSYHSFLLLKRSAAAEALEAAIFPSLAVRCTTHISPGYLRRDGLLLRARHHRDLSVSWTSAPSAADHTHTHKHILQESLSLETHWRELFREKNDELWLHNLIFFSTPCDKDFADSRNNHKMLCRVSSGLVLLNSEFRKLQKVIFRFRTLVDHFSKGD